MLAKTKPLGKLAENITVGYVGPMASEYVDKGVPFLRSLNVRPFSFAPSDLKYITREFHDKIKKSTLKPGDVVVVRTGNPGASCVIPDCLEEANCSDLVIIRCGKKLDPHFVSYYINSITHSQVKGQLVGAIQKHFNIGSAKELAFPDIDRSKQSKIADILSSLDAKIDCNNRINAELEAMAKTLYDYWFVQFDFPDGGGRPYKSSGGKMVYNHTLKREIPVEWKTEPLIESCRVIDCLHSKKPDYFFDAAECYLLQLENILDNGQIDLAKKYYVSKSDYETWTSRIEVTQHDVVMTNAGRTAAFAQVPVNVICGIGRNITAIRPTRILPNYFFLSLSGVHIQKQILTNLDQGAFFKSFNVKGIKILKLLRPTPGIEQEFEQRVASIIYKRHQLLAENTVLINLRDWLLPMLMNGQVTVA